MNRTLLKKIATGLFAGVFLLALPLAASAAEYGATTPSTTADKAIETEKEAQGIKNEIKEVRSQVNKDVKTEKTQPEAQQDDAPDKNEGILFPQLNPLQGGEQ